MFAMESERLNQRVSPFTPPSRSLKPTAPRQRAPHISARRSQVGSVPNRFPIPGPSRTLWFHAYGQTDTSNPVRVRGRLPAAYDARD